MVSSLLVLLGLAVNGFFTGLGVVLASILVEVVDVKGKFKGFHKKLRGVRL